MMLSPTTYRIFLRIVNTVETSARADDLRKTIAQIEELADKSKLIGPPMRIFKPALRHSN